MSHVNNAHFTHIQISQFRLAYDYYKKQVKGAWGVPWGQIMEKEFEYLVDRGGHGGHLAYKFLKKYCS